MKGNRKARNRHMGSQQLAERTREFSSITTSKMLLGQINEYTGKNEDVLFHTICKYIFQMRSERVKL